MHEPQTLTEREIEILELIAEGKSNKDIGEALHISANTVKVHLRNIFGKLEVSTRTEASMIALQRGLFTPAGAPEADEAVVSEIAEAAEETKDIEAPAPEPVLPVTVQPADIAGANRMPRTIYSIGFVIVIALLAVIAYRINQPAQPDTTPEAAEAFTLQSQWHERKNLPESRSRAAAVTYQEHVYVIGGVVGEEASDALLRFAPEQESWTRLAAKITAVSEIQAAALGGKIYAPGGRLSSGRVSDVLEIYDPVDDRWESGPSLPLGLSAYSLAAFEGKIFLFGGWDGTSFSDRTFSFSPEANTWTELTPMPAALGFAGAVQAAERIYIIGGYDGKNALTSNYVYTPAAEGNDPWSQAEDLPEGRYAIGLVSIADKIHLIGGSGGSSATFSQMYFDPQTNLWDVNENPLANEWSHIAVAPLGAEIYAIGGETATTATNRNLTFQALFIMMMPVIR